MGVLCDGICLVLQAPNRYSINQTTATSSLATLIKECLECLYRVAMEALSLKGSEVAGELGVMSCGLDGVM